MPRPLLRALLAVQALMWTDCTHGLQFGLALRPTRATPAALQRPPPIMMLDNEEDEEEEDEEDSMVPYEDWNLAWQRFNLEYVAAAYEVYEEYEEEGKDALRQVQVQTVVGTVVACAMVALCLYEYCVVTGGIVIAPSEHALIELHNFKELRHMPTSHLSELHIPGATMREAVHRALQDGGLAGWRSTLVSRTYTFVLQGVL